LILEACSLQNEEEKNLISFPRYDNKLDDANAVALDRTRTLTLEANTSLVTLTLEKVHVLTFWECQPPRLAYALLVSHPTNVKRLTQYDNGLSHKGVDVLIQSVFLQYHGGAKLLPNPLPSMHFKRSLSSIYVETKLVTTSQQEAHYWLIARALMQNPNNLELDKS
jgi:hypothetical protein